MTRAVLAIGTLCTREITRFLRQRSRVIGALGQPLVLWLLLGGGMKASFMPGGGVDYLEYFYPGIIALTLLFTSIFATISVVEDRKAGFLQGVLCSPVPRWSIVTGQAAGATLLALLQALVLLALAPLAGIALSAASVAASIGVMILLGFGLTGLGLLLAWRLDSTQGFHAIMNLVLLPMWFLSGAFFPAAGAPTWIAWMIAVNPMTYGMAALRRCLYLGDPRIAARTADLPGMGVSLAVVAALAVVTLLLAARQARRRDA